jgi:hypothetical protein
MGILFLLENTKGIATMADVGVYGVVILKSSSKGIRCEGMD